MEQSYRWGNLPPEIKDRIKDWFGENQPKVNNGPHLIVDWVIKAFAQHARTVVQGIATNTANGAPNRDQIIGTFDMAEAVDDWLTEL